MRCDAALAQDSEMAIRSNAQPPRRQGNWQNKVLARVVLKALGYNPSKHFNRITAPIFFRLALKDHLCPPDILHGVLDRAGMPEVSGVSYSVCLTFLHLCVCLPMATSRQHTGRQQ
jgi:hypothetical protein